MEADSDIKAGQIAHLNGRPDDNNPENLAFLCLRHHDLYDTTTRLSKGITIAEVKHYRDLLYDAIRREATAAYTLFGATPTRPAGRIAGKYVRDDTSAGATIEIANIDGDRVRVAGVALWGQGQRTGPRVGELEFEAELTNDRLSYSCDSGQGCTASRWRSRLTVWF